MAADFWSSTQYSFWQLTKNDLLASTSRAASSSLSAQFPLPEGRLLNNYLQQQLVRLGRRLAVRQVVLATALVFLRRFYYKVDIRHSNPYQVLTTAFYLASKVEECPHHIRVVVSEARILWSDFVHPDTSKLGECEFWLISELDAQLIIHHPYRSLRELETILNLTRDEAALSWSVVNDHYLTDLPFIHAPHLIALAAIVLAVVIRPSQSSQQTGAAPAKLAQLGSLAQSKSENEHSPQSKAQFLMGWLARSNIDMEALVDCVQELISLYAVLEQYSEKTCKEQLGNLVKARGVDKL